MNKISLKISDLYRLNGLQIPHPIPEAAEILALAERFFSFLPKSPKLSLQGDSISIHYDEQEKEGVDDPELLKSKESATDMYLLNALQRYSNMPVEKVQQIAFEIGFKAQEGVDFGDPSPKYTLKSLPDEVFSGLQLMCLLFAGFQRFAPEKELGMNLHDSFLRAVTLFTEVVEE